MAQVLVVVEAEVEVEVEVVVVAVGAGVVAHQELEEASSAAAAGVVVVAVVFGVLGEHEVVGVLGEYEVFVVLGDLVETAVHLEMEGTFLLHPGKLAFLLPDIVLLLLAFLDKDLLLAFPTGLPLLLLLLLAFPIVFEKLVAC